MTKKLWLLIATSVLLGLIAACGPAPTPETVTVVETVVVEKEVEGETVTVVETVEVVQTVEVEKEVVVEVEKEKPRLTIWQEASFVSEYDILLQRYIREYCEENGIECNIVLEAKNVFDPRWQVVKETGELPDVSFARRTELGPELNNLGLLLDVTDVAENLDSIGNGFYDWSLEAMSNEDGTVFAIPWGTSSDVLYYRADWLDEAGLEPAETWTELFDIAEALTIPGERFGLGLDFGCDSNDDIHITGYLYSYGASVWGEDGKTVTINSPETIQFLNDFKDAFDRGIFPPDVVTWAGRGNNEAYQSGQIAIAYNSPSIMTWMVENDPELVENTLLTPIPAGPAARLSASVLFANFVSKNTQHPELAKGLLEHVHHPDRQRELLNLLGRVSVYEDLEDLELFDDPNFAAFGEQLQYNVNLGYPGPVTLWELENTRVNIPCQMLSRVLVDGESPEDAAQWAEVELQKIYDSFQ